MFLFWATIADHLGATSSALGSGGFNRGCEAGASTKGLDPAVAFVVGWEIGTVAPVGDVGNLGTGVCFSIGLEGLGRYIARRCSGPQVRSISRGYLEDRGRDASRGLLKRYPGICRLALIGAD